MPEKGVTLILNFKGTLFSKKKMIQAKLSQLGYFRRLTTYPSEQDDMSKVGQYQAVAPGGGGYVYVKLFK